MADTVPTTPTPRATVRDYIVLTKPRVISLLLLTTVGAMFIAARGFPGWIPLIGVLLGGYMSAGAAGVFNMVYDRDIDERMRRTSKRPTVTQVVPTRNALVFGIALTVASFLAIALATNVLAALLSWGGIAYDVLIYTMWLKRSTLQKIVKGGAAGAIPPLVGWAAVTGHLSLLAWVLFALVFMWTPVHFWALALMIKDEYHKVGVPMAPAVIGERATVMQMVMYAVLTMVLTVAPFFLHVFSPAYFLAALGLNVVLALRVLRLFQIARTGTPIDKVTALPLYKYSMTYLALVFLSMALDRIIF
ncbi:MAG: heme o synthase [Deinococcales bacterium]